MNFWTGLILGVIIGWLVEWLIDWLFWRREVDSVSGETLAAEQRSAELELDYQNKLAAAEQDYHDRLAAVEEEWRARLNLNEQQWQAQFAAVEADREALRAQLTDISPAGIDELAPDEVEAAPYVDEFAGMEPAEDEGDILPGWAVVTAAADELAAGTLEAMTPDEGAVMSDMLENDERFSEAVLEDPFHNLLEADADALAAPVVASESGPVDDLTRIRGIGPRFAALLADGGVRTYEDLAAADPDRLRAIINPGPMQQLNFTSWSAQATAFAATRASVKGDDLTRLEGIGPVYAERLHAHGITTFGELAAADETTLATIISPPAWRRINYRDWTEQARLAAAGDADGLRALQSRLYQREGDNLGLIRGVGQRSAGALRAAGIDNFAALAAASPEQVEAAVRAGGGRGGDYAAWIEEAGRRAAGHRIARTTRRARGTYVASCPQDLSAVPGIGTVFEQRLYAAGIGSYWELAELPADELVTVLGERAGGVDVGSIKAEAMRLAAESNAIGRTWSGTPPDDFEEIGGIGEIYERRLYDAGICTFAALAATSPERLAEICQAPALRVADYAAWISHATELAAARSG